MLMIEALANSQYVKCLSFIVAMLSFLSSLHSVCVRVRACVCVCVCVCVWVGLKLKE